MSKLSPALKQLINAPFARPGALPAPQGIKTFYQNLAKDAKDRGVGVPAWLSMAVCHLLRCSIPSRVCRKLTRCAKQTATTMTMNSPDSLAELFHAATPDHDAVATAELMREVGLKCIGFNGVRLPPFHLYLCFLSPSLSLSLSQ
jgi:hypothetical protein